jgi:hypothetical protein
MTDTSALQFERAEFTQSSAAASCAACNTPLHSSYFLINGRMACEACRYGAEAPDTSSGLGRLARATGAGTAAAIGGAVAYYAISAITGYEFALMAIVVGLAVGGAVKWGARGRGGWRYQALAMALTYLSIVATYLPPVIKGLRQHRDDTAASAPVDAGVAQTREAGAADARPPTFRTFAVAMILLVGLICALPFLGGLQNIMGLVIIGIGLYEAWKINRRVPLVISGPHAIDATPVSAG